MPTILHLSDTHRTADEPISNDEILHALLADLDSHHSEGIPAPDLVVLSGDLTQSAEPSEYEEAADLIVRLLEHLKLKTDRLVLVPGNHDIHWPTSEEAFVLRKQKPAGVDKDLVIALQGEHLCARSEDEYQRRLAHFRTFYKKVKGEDYPAARKAQFTIHEFSDLKVAIAGLNSCDLNDHRRFHGRMHISAIAGAATALAKYDGLRLAVWHHDLNWRGEIATSDFLDTDSLRQLSIRAFDLGLCGHTHRPASHDVHNIAERGFPVVSAGSLCTGKRERGDSVPRSYNVIELRADNARVNVRVREEKSSPWIGIARFKEPVSGSHVPWYEVDYARRKQSPPPTATPSSGVPTPRIVERTPIEAKSPTPFAEMNARSMSRIEVVSQYVWTEVAAALDSAMSQIVLGPRGSGKTALLLSLTLDGRAASARYRGSPPILLERLGLMCPMNVAEITAFNGKGWLPKEEREAIFSGTIATLWAQEFVSTIEKAEAICKEAGLDAPSESEAVALLRDLWSGDQTIQTYSQLRIWIKNLRSQLIRSLAVRNDEKRQIQIEELSRHALSRGGPGLLSDAAAELGRWSAYKATRWIVLFDEVEYLNEWQQQLTYIYLSHGSDLVSAKIATLPYAHARAIQNGNPRLIEGNDFRELPLTLTAALEFQSVDEEGSTKDFVEVAQGIWASRLERAGLEVQPLEEVWVETDYEEVLNALGSGLPRGRSELETQLLQQLGGETRTRAAELLEKNRTAFLDQYWRRYNQPFRFRLAHQMSKSVSIPLFWGWKTLLRACDGNCRWFLHLADKCWQLYWSKDGIRRLTATEQHSAVAQWADSVYKVCGTITERGDDLKHIVDQVGRDLRSRLYNPTNMVEEALNVRAQDLSPDQAEAVAIGVAYGYIVPKLDKSETTRLAYPTSDVELRLGFPIAVSKQLPLRGGSTIKIGDLRQVVFPWLKD